MNNSLSNIKEHIKDTLLNISDTGKYYIKVSNQSPTSQHWKGGDSIMVSIGNIEVIKKN